MEKIPAETCKAYWIVPPVRIENNCLEIIEKSAQYFDLKSKDLMTRKRHRKYVIPRMIIMHALYHNAKYKPTFSYIGKLFNRDHSTVINAVKALEDLCEVDNEIFKQVRDFHEYIYGHVDYFNAGIRQKKQLIKI